MKPHARSSELRDLVRQCTDAVGPWSGTVYRSATPRYARSSDVLTGEGSQRHGGRWNPPGSFPTVYASTTPETAMAESLAQYRYYAISIQDAMPRTFVALNLTFVRLLDLTNEDVRRRVKVSEQMLSDDWRKQNDAGQESLTQSLGRAACEEGLEAILVPSAADPAGKNIAWFPANLQRESVVEILRAEMLDG